MIKNIKLFFFLVLASISLNIKGQGSVSPAGLHITKETLSLVNGIGKLNIKTVTGVYMLTITNNQTGERVVKKLVINK